MVWSCLSFENVYIGRTSDRALLIYTDETIRLVEGICCRLAISMPFLYANVFFTVFRV